MPGRSGMAATPDLRSGVAAIPGQPGPRRTVMLPEQLNSSDSHVVEPPDLWQSGMEPAFAERAPRVVREATGDWWYADGVRLASMIGGTDVGLRFEHQEELRREAKLEQVR